jgi:hypothetical protein
MPALQTRLEILEREKNAIVQLLRTIERAQRDETWLDPELFSPFLTIGLRYAGVTPADLANSEKIGRSAVSKWKSGDATPTQPTRKTVLLWIISALENRKDEIVAEIDKIPMTYEDPDIEPEMALEDIA